MRQTYLNPKKRAPKDSTMKDHLKSLWLNARSMIYAGLTLGGVLIVLLGSVLLLPILLVLVVGFVVFIAYKMALYEREDD